MEGFPYSQGPLPRRLSQGKTAFLFACIESISNIQNSNFRFPKKSLKYFPPYYNMMKKIDKERFRTQIFRKGGEKG